MMYKVRVLLVLFLSLGFILTIPVNSQDYVISKNEIKYQVRDITELIAKPLLKAYRNFKVDEIGFSEIAFSPSGRYLAFISYDVIWILDLYSKKVKRVSPPNYFNLIVPMIQNIYWDENDVLLAKIEICNYLNQKFNKQIYLCANMEFSSYSYTPIINVDEKRSFRQHPSQKFAINALGYRIELINKKNKVKNTLKLNDSYLETDDVINWSEDGETFMFTDNAGHGDIRLYAGYTKPYFHIQEIGRRSWELTSYDLSKNNNYIVYPNWYSMVFYDYSKKKIIDEIDFGTYVAKFSWNKNNEVAFWQSGGKRKPFLWRLKILQFK